MRKILAFLLSIGFIIFYNCDENTVLNPGDENIVVRGYIYANEPVWDIQITHTLELGSTNSIAPPINDASVVFVKNNQQFQLKPSPGDSGFYHFDGDDLSIETGDEIEIQVSYGEKYATGKTKVPEPPLGLFLENDNIYIPSFTGFPQQGGFDRTSMELQVSWETNKEALYYVVVENIDENPTEIETGFPGGRGPMRFVYPPTNRNEYVINAMTLTHYGNHIIKVYRVNQEYADLYGSRQQDSRELNEPLTNIKGGLGIFSAFNSATAYFYVLPEKLQ